MKKFFIHAGLYKTGTTYLQHQLWNNRKALERAGVRYLPIFFHVFRGMRDNTPLDQEHLAAFRLAFDKAAKERFHTFILSGEALCHLPDPELMAEQLCYATQHYEVELIFTLRRQDTFVESMYVQSIKEGGSDSFKESLAKADLSVFNWNRLIKAFEICGKVSTVNYESKSYVRDFFKVFTDIEIALEDTTDNPSYSSTAIEIAKLCNPVLDLNGKNKLRELLTKHLPKPRGEGFGLFTDEERKAFMDNFKEGVCGS